MWSVAGFALALSSTFTPISAQGDAKSSPAQAPPAPPTAPEEPRGLRLRKPGAFDGYTLLAPINSKSIHLIDLDGKVVHTWATARRPGAATYFLDNGHLLRGGMQDDNPRFHGGGIGGWIEELDWEGKVVWEFELASDDRTLHHDFKLMPNGNLLAIAWEYHSRDEAMEHGRDPQFAHAEGLWTDVLLEIKPKRPSGGDIVWTWRSWDHLVQDFNRHAQGYGDPKEHPGLIDINVDHRFLPKAETDEERQARERREEEMKALGYTGGKTPPPSTDPRPGPKIESDWLHTNSVDYLAAQDLILVSTPRLSEIWVIDHSTTTQEAAGSAGGKWKKGGDLLYRWGNARNYGAGDDAGRQLFAQHNATWQPGAKTGELRVLLFNNGAQRPVREYSSVEELVLPFDPERGFVRDATKPFGPDAPVWSYSEPEHFFSSFISGAQRLPNGDTLICEGAKGRVFEITGAGEIVWDYLSPLGGEIEPSPQGGKAPPKALFRATSLAKNHPGLAGRF
jgi:hypothetical protein